MIKIVKVMIKNDNNEKKKGKIINIRIADRRFWRNHSV